MEFPRKSPVPRAKEKGASQMKIRVSSVALGRFCYIDVWGINFTFQNISAVLKPFNINHGLITIVSLKHGSPVFEELDSMQLKYTRSNVGSNTEEVSVEVSLQSIDNVLRAVLEDDSDELENIYIESLLIDLKECYKDCSTKMLKKGFSDAKVQISFDECDIYVVFDKRRYDYKKIRKQIRGNLANI